MAKGAILELFDSESAIVSAIVSVPVRVADEVINENIDTMSRIDKTSADYY